MNLQRSSMMNMTNDRIGNTELFQNSAQGDMQQMKDQINIPQATVKSVVSETPNNISEAKVEGVVSERPTKMRQASVEGVSQPILSNNSELSKRVDNLEQKVSKYEQQVDKLEGKKKLYTIHSMNSLNHLKKDKESVMLMITFLACDDEDRKKIIQGDLKNEPVNDTLQSFYSETSDETSKKTVEDLKLKHFFGIKGKIPKVFIKECKKIIKKELKKDGIIGRSIKGMRNMFKRKKRGGNTRKKRRSTKQKSKKDHFKYLKRKKQVRFTFANKKQNIYKKKRDLLKRRTKKNI